MTHTLESIVKEYGVPDPSIIGKLPRGGIQLDFVGHAEITRILIEIDSLWSWEPVAWTEAGRPAITETNGMATMWGRLTVLNKSMLGVGSCKSDKADLDKELIGDFLRNAAMRFGICLSLWSKAEWQDAPKAKIVAISSGPSNKANYLADSIREASTDEIATEAQIKKINVLRSQLSMDETAWRAKLKSLYNTDSIRTLSKTKASDLISKLTKAVDEK